MTSGKAAAIGDRAGAEPGQRSIGFGCATLFQLPSRRDRRAVLDTAVALGIRHFDVAPSYGLGVAERELRPLLRGHPDIRVATKFGIRPTRLGRLAGRTQAPARQVLRRATSLQASVKRSGSKDTAGVVSTLLYRGTDLSVANARRTLAESRRALGTDHIEYFLLHDPAHCPPPDLGALVDYLETERQRGNIGGWGPAGVLSPGLEPLASAPVRQTPYRITDGAGPAPTAGQQRIIFGFLAEALPALTALLDRRPLLRAWCSGRLDADLSERRTVVQLLVRDAMAHAAPGILLVSSTRPENLEMLCTAAALPLPNETEVAQVLSRELSAS